jgi:hypothetical protein
VGGQKADQLAAEVRAGQTVRIEVMRPTDLFTAQKQPASPKEAYRAALAIFPRRQVTVPRWLADQSTVCDGLEEIFAVAEVNYSKTMVNGWLVFSFDKPGNASVTSTWTNPEAQSHALRLMTAWSGEGDQLISRVLLDEVYLLQRLTGCLAAAGREFGAKWIPAYCPTEIHIGPNSGIASSHVQAANTMSRIQDCFSVSVEGAGSLIIGLALIA